MTTATPGYTRYTQDKPCPICAGWDRMPRGSGQRCYGYLTATGKTAMCTREEKAGGLPLAPGSDAYAHPLHGPCACGAGEGDSPDHSGHRKGARRRVGRAPGSRVEKRYDYRDEQGNLLFQHERWWPKDFTFRAPDGAGGWKEGKGCMTGVRLVPWRLPELLADTKRMLIITEGEKDCEVVRDGFGLPATTCAGGAGKWTPEMVQIVVERQRVPIIIGDNDPAGIRGADKVAALMHAAGLRPRVLPPLGPREGFDLYDWVLEEGGTREQLLEMIRDCPTWIPPNVAALDLPEMQPNHGGPDGHANSNGFHHGPDGLPAFTDTRNAERLVERFGERIRKDFTRGKKRALGGWRLWDGMRWFLDETELIVRHAKEVVNHLPDEIPDHLHHETVKKLQRDCLGCESTGRLHALITNAGNLVATTHADWDSDPWLLNCRNGTVDLHSGELLEHRPERYLSKMAPVDYDPEMPTPIWDAFLERVFAGDAGLIAFVQRAVGLSLVGKVIEHVLFVMYGTGANGKSTFTNVWLELLGDYSRAASMDLLVETKNPQHPTSIAELVGMRFIATAEVQGQFSERVVKLLTGGDVRNARFLFEDAFTYTPSDTFWLATNHKPTITGNSEGIWRRIRLLPFAVTVPPGEQDAALPAKLRAEYPGILAWAVRGCVDWQRDGLGSADAVDAATATYRSEMDTMATFLADRCVVGPHCSVAAGGLYKAFQDWCEEVGERDLSQRFFGIRLGERGFTRRKAGPGRKWHWIGLALRTDGDDPVDDPGPPPPRQRTINYEPAEPDLAEPVENPDAFDGRSPWIENPEIKRVHEPIIPNRSQARALSSINNDTSTTRARARQSEGSGFMDSLDSPQANAANEPIACQREIREYGAGETACPECGGAMQHYLHAGHWDHDCRTCALRFRSV